MACTSGMKQNVFILTCLSFNLVDEALISSDCVASNC
jgi:hypothetical protein